MEAKDLRPADARGMLPYLRSIARELEERTAEVAHLERRQQALSGAPRAHRAELREIEAELATHRFECRAAERELGRLGFAVAAARPVRLQALEATEPSLEAGRLEQTGFFLRPPGQ